MKRTLKSISLATFRAYCMSRASFAVSAALLLVFGMLLTLHATATKRPHQKHVQRFFLGSHLAAEPDSVRPAASTNQSSQSSQSSVLERFERSAAHVERVFIVKQRLPESIAGYHGTILPLISANGKRLYFDRKWHPDNSAGEADFDDIWYADKNPNTTPAQGFSAPRNLGSPLNTRGSDVLCSISPDGALALVYGHYERDESYENYKSDQSGAQDAQDAEVGKKDRRLPATGEPASASQRLSPVPPTSADGTINAASTNGAVSIGFSGVKTAGFSVARRTLDDRGNELWSAPQPITIENFSNRAKKYYAHLAADNRTMLLALERSDTRGGLDLYVAFRHDTSLVWSAPKNLGSSINTGSYEGSPFLAPDGKTLYFSSEGHNERGNLGAADLFVSRRLDDSWERWSPPMNLGSGINSGEEDSSIDVLLDGTGAYYVSSEPTAGKGIYYSELADSVQALPALVLEGSVFVAPALAKSVLAKSLFTKSAQTTIPVNVVAYRIAREISTTATTTTTSRFQPLSLTAISQITATVALPNANNAALESASALASAPAPAYASKSAKPRHSSLVGQSVERNTLLTKQATKPLIKQDREKFALALPATALESAASSTANTVSYVVRATAPGLGSAAFVLSSDPSKRFEKRMHDFVLTALDQSDKSSDKSERQYPRRVASIGFEQDAAMISDANAAQLAVVRLMLEDLSPADRAKAIIEVTGHACDIGSDERNNELSQQRAAATAAALEQLGVPRAMMRVVGVGKRKLLVRSNTDDARRQNRRAELVLVLE
jgi:outer membrane protein OmpA-like peptidoglycan-associated protein